MWKKYIDMACILLAAIWIVLAMLQNNWDEATFWLITVLAFKWMEEKNEGGTH